MNRVFAAMRQRAELCFDWIMLTISIWVLYQGVAQERYAEVTPLQGSSAAVLLMFLLFAVHRVGVIYQKIKPQFQR